jgi:ATP-dependent Lhr-like helicase
MATAGDSPDAFGRLAPFIQEFIWKHGWTEMREIQVQAIAAAFDTDRHLLLAAGTASGKTEAAFLPILTELHTDPPTSVGALYIGPLKALINDQFLRLTDLCVEAEIPVTPWHGDVGASRKHALLKRPSGILQITPEALEGLLLNRGADLRRLFGDLRWVVIDEVHAFMGSDRGGQVLGLLDRLARYANDPAKLPRRVGLSATLGDYAEAAAWLDGGTGRGVEIIADSTARTVFLMVDHFRSAAPSAQAVAEEAAGDDDEPEMTGTSQAHPGDAMIALQADLFQAAFSATQGKKSLIFTNSRSDAEKMITGLRRMSERVSADDIYHVHHGNIAAALRESAEEAMRDGTGPACTAATVTLELGIDLGQLDRVLQLGAPFSVASFLQRLGRAGRRGQRPEMFFMCLEEEPQATATLLERIPWELLQSIALIQLYAEEKWVEPLARPALPGSLLYHQTMSVLAAGGELSPAALAERVLTLSPFRLVTQDDFRGLLLHLLAIDHIQRTAEGGLILGLTGERVVRNYKFLATFADPTEWAVKHQARDVGSISDAVPVGERFALAGRTWEVLDLNVEQRILSVRRVRGSLRTKFTGDHGGAIHDRVVERMRRVLAESTVYSYLTPRAVARLAEARALATSSEIAERPTVVPLGGNLLGLLPWCGTRKLTTMELRLRQEATTQRIQPSRFYLTLAPDTGDVDAALADMALVASGPWSATQLTEPLTRAILCRDKYDEFLPDALLRQSFASQQLDPAGAAEAFIRTIFRPRP